MRGKSARGTHDGGATTSRKVRMTGRNNRTRGTRVGGVTPHVVGSNRGVCRSQQEGPLVGGVTPHVVGSLQWGIASNSTAYHPKEGGRRTSTNPMAYMRITTTYHPKEGGRPNTRKPIGNMHITPLVGCKENPVVVVLVGGKENPCWVALVGCKQKTGGGATATRQWGSDGGCHPT